MKEEIKPIKRSKELAPLSREHHDGLLFAWKIKQGLENNISAERMGKYALWFWRHHIKPHFYQEEKILMPFLPDDNPLKIRLKEEHDHIRELIIGIDDETGADKRHLTILMDLLNQHIRFEERELFPLMEQLLTQVQLEKIFKELEEHPVSCENYEDEFWVKKKN